VQANVIFTRILSTSAMYDRAFLRYIHAYYRSNKYFSVATKKGLPACRIVSFDNLPYTGAFCQLPFPKT
jgi:hypothetical protein